MVLFFPKKRTRSLFGRRWIDSTHGRVALSRTPEIELDVVLDCQALQNGRKNLLSSIRAHAHAKTSYMYFPLAPAVSGLNLAKLSSGAMDEC